MRSLVESDWEPRTSHPSDGSSSKYSTRKNRFQVQVQETEDERTCNHNNQVCSIMEQCFEPLRGMLYTLKRDKLDSVYIVFVEA